MHSPNFFSQPAAMSVVQVYLMKTRMVLAGKSKSEIDQGIAAGREGGELPAPRLAGCATWCPGNST